MTIAFSRRLDALAAESSTLVAAITHDNILSTLLFGAANNPLFRPAVAAQAKRALAEIDRLAVETTALDAVDIRLFWARAEQLVLSLAPETSILRSEAGRGRIPDVVAEATLAALLQAVTNSVVYAGPAAAAAKRTLTLAGTAENFEVRLEDLGVGFDPARIPASRVGIRSSIKGRMTAVAGGAATVESRPGHGAVVSLTWRSAGSGSEEAGSTRQHPRTPGKSGDLLSADIVTVRLGRIVSGIFILGQVCLFVASTINGANWAASLVALLALCVPVVVLERRRFLSSRYTVVAILTGTGIASSMMFFQSFASPVMRQGFWFLTLCAFVLMWLLRDRRSWLATGLDLDARPVVILLVATVCSMTVSRLQRRIPAVRSETSRSLEEATFNAAARVQRHAEAIRLRSLAGPLLEGRAAEQELTPAQIQECVAIEVSLRDDVLGGRLRQGEFAAAAGNARR